MNPTTAMEVVALSEATTTTTKAAAPSSFFETVPRECSSHVLSFVGLRDVLNFGAASSSCMRIALPDLHRRRMRTVRAFAYWRGWKAGKGGRPAGVVAETQGKIALLDDVVRVGGGATAATTGSAGGWSVMPTVLERVEQVRFVASLCYRRVVISFEDQVRCSSRTEPLT